MAALALGVILAGSAWAAELLEEPPVYGAFYDRYEPSFYTALGRAATTLAASIPICAPPRCRSSTGSLPHF